MNRRELFAGAGAAALSAAVPVPPVGPITATEIRDLQEKAYRDHDYGDVSTSLWFVVWGDGTEPYLAGSLPKGLSEGRQLLRVGACSQS